MQHHDFTEGVTALLVRKEQPKWQPESLAAIPTSENVSQPFFDFGEEQSLELFTDRTYSDYPYQALGVPAEKEIKAVVSSNSYTPQELTKAVLASRNGRQGIADVASEIISRKTTVNGQGKVKWVNEDASASPRL
jgi:3-hydroxyisobutyryl-CoA hydrolase